MVTVQVTPSILAYRLADGDDTRTVRVVVHRGADSCIVRFTDSEAIELSKALATLAGKLPEK